MGIEGHSYLSLGKWKNLEKLLIDNINTQTHSIESFPIELLFLLHYHQQKFNLINVSQIQYLIKS